MEQSMLDRLTSATGRPVYDSRGEKLGKIEGIYYDWETKQPEWVGIGTGFMGTKRAVVPLEGADLREDGLYVPHDKSQVKDSPEVGGAEISPETEQELYAHYGLSYSRRESSTGLAEGEARRGDEGQVTRHEEQLTVGAQPVEAGRARLRKWVETEPVEVDVELKRETARVTREPVEYPVSGAEIGEQEIEVPLQEERPVVQKQAVAKERVGLEKDVETERETLRDTVRKERIDVEESDR